MKPNIINIDSLEIFKEARYINEVNENAYLSIIVTNNCQMRCSYCINSETDYSLDLPIDKAISNIRELVRQYGIKEAILLGGEPLLHPNIFELIKRLRTETGLKFLRLTTNGIKLKDNIEKLVDKDFGIQGLNISFHNEDFITLEELREVYRNIKSANKNIKVRVNTNIWRGNLDYHYDLISHLRRISFVDEVRVSNIIPKDSFSVNTKVGGADLILSDKEYEYLFNKLIGFYSDKYTIINNNNTLGFVRYLLIPSRCPIIINWNIDSKVCEQVNGHRINTFKCLVSGDISLSWNSDNIII